MTKCAGIILAGGLNTRMDGRNKAFLTIGGQTFLDRIIGVVNSCCDETLLVTREPEKYVDRGIRVVTDILTVRSALAGIHAGLVNMRAEYGVFIGCDTPLIKTGVIRILMDAAESGFDIIVPSSATYFQPLCAVYTQSCAPVIEDQLQGGDLKIANLFARMAVKKISYDQFRVEDARLVSFFNINTIDDLKHAEAGDFPDIV